MQLDDTDKAILNFIQSDFPLTPQPYAQIGQRLGLSEGTVLERVAALKKNGIIRRIGGNFVPEKLGYVSTLCAARVPEDRIEDFAAAVNAFAGVTHNYIRDNRLNVWFTFIAPSMEMIQKNLDEISRQTGITEIYNLPATRVFKIKAEFTL
ncbi:MAG: AsnC family transcriptional regulator [Thermodesulfobacteriota bacterium]|nr:AsnC family transcriptional regulator [Thermodesulfobacteriota bacterium]